MTRSSSMRAACCRRISCGASGSTSRRNMALPERLRAVAFLGAAALLGPVSVSAGHRPVDALEGAKTDIRRKDFAAATTELQRLAGGGNRDAQYLLAVLYLNGLNGPRDLVKAREWLEKSATLGNARAAASLSALSSGSASANLADVELSDPETRAEALWLAAATGDLPRLQTIANQQALESRDPFGRGALARAAEAGHAEAVAFLLGRGASVDARDAHGVTPLMLATRAASLDTVEALLK